MKLSRRAMLIAGGLSTLFELVKPREVAAQGEQTSEILRMKK
jgi:hypothetical protein